MSRQLLTAMYRGYAYMEVTRKARRAFPDATERISCASYSGRAGSHPTTREGKLGRAGRTLPHARHAVSK